MTGEVQSALIAAGAAILVAIVSLGATIRTNIQSGRMQRAQAVNSEDLERLKIHLSNESDSARAKRDYEYEARKRLYTELYPLAYQLHQAALHAQHRIMNLALATRDGFLAAGEDNWLMGHDAYYFTAVIHNLLAPLAIYELMTRRLTDLDLRLDYELSCLHFIAGKSYQAMRSDFDFASHPFPPIVFGSGSECYKPPEVRQVDMPQQLPQRWTWRQGIYSGQISLAVDSMLIKGGAAERVMTYAEFAKALGGTDLRIPDDCSVMKRGLKPLIDVFLDFHPARRPVTWRILLAQGACYRAVAALRAGLLEPTSILCASQFAGSKDRMAFDWIGDSQRSIPPSLRDHVDFTSEQESAFDSADLFIRRALEDFGSNSASLRDSATLR